MKIKKTHSVFKTLIKIYCFFMANQKKNYVK